MLKRFLVLFVLVAWLAGCGGDAAGEPESCLFKVAPGTLIACYEAEGMGELTCAWTKTDGTRIDGALLPEEPCPANGVLCKEEESGERFFVYGTDETACAEWHAGW